MEPTSQIYAARRYSDAGTIQDIRFDQVIVAARIFRPGMAMTQSCDLEGSSAPVGPGATDLSIVITSAPKLAINYAQTRNEQASALTTRILPEANY